MVQKQAESGDERKRYEGEKSTAADRAHLNNIPAGLSKVLVRFVTVGARCVWGKHQRQSGSTWGEERVSHFAGIAHPYSLPLPLFRSITNPSLSRSSHASTEDYVDTKIRLPSSFGLLSSNEEVAIGQGNGKLEWSIMEGVTIKARASEPPPRIVRKFCLQRSVPLIPPSIWPNII